MMEQNKDINYRKLITTVLLVFLTITIIYPIIIHFLIQPYKESGTFGDSFGAVNSLFSGLALAGVIISLYIQRSELKLQRDEMALQREEMSLQRGEMVNSRYELIHNRYINLLHLQLEKYQNGINDFKFKNEFQNYSGNIAMYEFYKCLNDYDEKIQRLSKEEARKNWGKLKTSLDCIIKNEKEISNLILSTCNSLLPIQTLFNDKHIKKEDVRLLELLVTANVGLQNHAVFIMLYHTVKIVDDLKGEFHLTISEKNFLNNFEEMLVFLKDIIQTITYESEKNKNVGIGDTPS